MPCKSHEIFFPSCGHIFRCEEPLTIIDPSSYDPWDHRRYLPPHTPHTSIEAHPCNKHLPRTISSADQSPVGSWRMCPECQGGPKLPEHFKLQRFSRADEYWEWDWSSEWEEMEQYYEKRIREDAQVEWLFESTYGTKWNLTPGGLYEWEKDAGMKKSCRERTAEQQLRDQRL